MNFAGAFLGLLLLGLGAAGFLLSARVSGLSRDALHPELGFDTSPSGAIALESSTTGPPEGTHYLLVSTEGPTPVQRALALVGIVILVLSVATASALVIWNTGSALIHAIFHQWLSD